MPKFSELVFAAATVGSPAACTEATSTTLASAAGDRGPAPAVQPRETPKREPDYYLVQLERVKVNATRSGGDVRWDASAREAGEDPGCGLLTAIATAAHAGVGGIIGALCSVSGPSSAREGQREHPDLYVEFRFDGVVYTSTVIPDQINHEHPHALIVPREAARNGMEVAVYDRDGTGENPELAGKARVAADAFAVGRVLSISEPGSDLDRVELRILEPPALGRLTSFSHDVSSGMAEIPEFDVPAGAVIQVSASGRYRIGSWDDDPVGPEGYPGGGPKEYNFPSAPFRKARHGGAVVVVQRDSHAEGELVAPCVRFVAAGGGRILVGVNDDDPHNNRGHLEFVLETDPPTLDEWKRPGEPQPCAARPR